MIVELNKIVSWKEIEKIKEMAKDDIVIVRIPKSVYNNKKMKYKIEVLKEIPTVVINIEEKPRGRKIKIPESILNKAIDLLKERGLTEVAELLAIPETTLYYHFEKHKEKINKEREEFKMQKLKQLLWEYKEMIINKGFYNAEMELKFLELELKINNKEFDDAKKILNEIKYRIKKKK